MDITYSKRPHDGLSCVNRLKIFTARQLEQIPQVRRLPETTRRAIRIVARVLPFRVNRYVVDELIDWDNIPNDPIFQLIFPQPGMLAHEDFERIGTLMDADAPQSDVEQAVREIRLRLNPHPAGQHLLNIPELGDNRLAGMQHKYRETVLFFPRQGQTCFSYCSFCFRWPQFIGDEKLRFAASQTDLLQRYLMKHREVSDLLLTGGDPLVMRTKRLTSYLLPLLSDEFAHVQTIRIGTKALSFWPHRFVSDPDAAELLQLLEWLVKNGKHVAIMAHFNHWRELSTPMAREAIRLVRSTGAVIRSQSPLLAHINDDAEVWARLWREQVRLGIVPYYMFVKRDTGASRYFRVPLAKALQIYREAVTKVSGIARTVRGPSMSVGPGKIEVQGVAEVQGEKVFVLRFIQGRNPDWVQRPFFARYDKHATWLDHLRPAFGKDEFFFQPEYRNMVDNAKLQNIDAA
ncbi:MAG: lysine 2,3-aminomutase [Desulfobulbaceae bacterium]|nr:lysine 2,3-aminomutase [Desulfobulbaceae bacterium]